MAPSPFLYRPAKQPWLAQMMLTARNRGGIQAVPTTLSGVRQMIKALRKGQAVGLLPDQVPPHGQGQWAPVFWQRCLHHDTGGTAGIANRGERDFGALRTFASRARL